MGMIPRHPSIDWSLNVRFYKEIKNGKCVFCNGEGYFHIPFDNQFPYCLTCYGTGLSNDLQFINKIEINSI